MREEIVLVIAGGHYQYKRWLANNQLLGKEHIYRYIKDEEHLLGYRDNKVIFIGTPHNNPVYNSPRLEFIRRNYDNKLKREAEAKQ